MIIVVLDQGKVAADRTVRVHGGCGCGGVAAVTAVTVTDLSAVGCWVENERGVFRGRVAAGCNEGRG